MNLWMCARAVTRRWGMAWLLVLFGLVACSPDKPQFKSIDVTGANYAQGFTLTDAQGQRRSLQDFKGKVVVVFFGYTQCPDVCPTSLQELADTRRLLGPDGDKLQGVFVTVDPARDTPELLKKYVPQFNPSFDALTASSLDELKPLLTGLRVFAGKVEGSSPENYLMDHTSASYVFDQQGRARLLVRHNADSTPVVEDVAQILAGK